ncbi:RNA polymerase sigma-70 factor, ECF subfamily [Chitinophaga sp. CF118]|uniref:RNA polymerase sigma factor n=1 Tax=Chitinophaga sp. CF118 TaxID=1884367 RepID=UPI0008EF73CF|nr:RNA polymerase sigma-70 factor [Chitinophaga sp. CF118]SFE35292.1 RNA polymerase sigma-70 factor, ECF subfamily [Chitinophaga sp. CF118]
MNRYGEMSNEELTDLLRSGDRSAFAEIYHRYKFILHNHAWQKTRNQEEAQDAIQDVFTTLWDKRESINVGSNLAGYLYNSVRNHILNTIAHKEVQTKYIISIQKFTKEQSVITDYRVRENLFKALIEKEIAALPPRMREVFELSRKHHLSHKEIAIIMGTTEQTVKKQMTIALKILRRKLGLMTWIIFCLLYR